MATYSLVIDDEMSCIGAPAEVRLWGQYFFCLIEGNFADQVKLHV